MRWPLVLALALLSGSAALAWRATGDLLVLVPYVLPGLLGLGLALAPAAAAAVPGAASASPPATGDGEPAAERRAPDVAA